MRKKRLSKWMLLASAVMVVALVAAACGGEEEEDPAAAVPIEKKGVTVKIAELDWTGQLIDINLAKIILEEEMGYDVELIYADYAASWTAMAAGDLHIGVELWPSSSQELMQEFLEEFGGNGEIEHLGPMGIIGQSTWYVPTYVIEGDPERGIDPMCPELANDLLAFNDCKDLFATIETAPQGRWVGCYVVGWLCHEELRLANLGLDFQQVYIGSEVAAITEWDAAYSRGEAIVMSMWEPHWMHTVYDMTRVPLPEYTPECLGEVEGVEPTYACDLPQSVNFNMGNPDFLRENPEVAEFFRNFHLSNDQQAEMLLAIDIEERPLDEVAREWIAENEDVWRAWIPEGY